jgi:uncharacterized protein (TIGR02217 family)
MSNSVFPVLAGLEWSVTKTPMWRTKIQTSTSGKELRAAYMSYPVWKFAMSYAVLRADAANAELQNLMGFFNQRNGSFDSFLYTDPTDNSVTAQQFGLGSGAQTAFQITRTYGSFVEPVQNLNGSPAIYVGGVLKTLTTDYTINSTGLVTFGTPPGNGVALTWTGSFYFRVRFLKDMADFDNFMYQLWQLKKCELQSIKL